MLPKGHFQAVAKSFFGLEELLASEIKAQGGMHIKMLKRAVQFNCDYETLYKCNYWCRTALRIMVPIASFKIRNEKDLYQKIYDLKWEEVFSNRETFIVDPTVYSDLFRHTNFPALKAKDAIVDRFRDKTGDRPNVGRENPDHVINLHIANNQVTVSLDASGDPLFKRGYRNKTVAAPLNECMAAGLILLSDWDQKSDLVDVFCGSGTIPIEAALIAKNIPPQFRRAGFGFMNWPNYDVKLWDSIVADAEANTKEINFKITATDSDQKAVRIANENVVRANLRRNIKVDQADFRTHKINGNTTIISNPPYGVRLNPEDMISFYEEIGSWLKHSCTDTQAYLFSSNLQALKFVGLRPSRKTPLYNGSLECKLHKYEIYDGSKKAKKQNG